VPVQLLAITDLHGYFGSYTTTVPGARAGEPPITVGGGAYLSTHLDRLREQSGVPDANSILFSAGDDFSGWPDETEWFWNEPTIEYLNLIGLEFSTIGNHELDRNLSYLRHMMDGSCEGRPDGDLCFVDSTGRRFAGADFDYYSANVSDPVSGEPVAEPYHVRLVDDGNGGTVPVGFIHATSSLTPNEGLSYWPREQLAFTPEAAAINRYAEELRAQGVEAIVAVVHEGFTQAGGAGFNECKDPSGPMFEMNKEISSAVDAIVTGHWHALVNCMLPDPDGNLRPVVEGANHGRLITELNLEIDRATGDVVRERTTATHHANTRDVPPDPEVQRLAQYWLDRLAERRTEVVGRTSEDLLRTSRDPEEAALPNLVADAYQFAAEQEGPVDLALSMPGTLRRDLTYAPDPSRLGDGPGLLLFPEVMFNTVYEDGIGPALVTATVTGRQLDALLESQWQPGADGQVTFRPIAVSDSVSYRYDPTGPVGERVAYGRVSIDGKPLRPTGEYRVAALSNNFVARYAHPGMTVLFGARDQHRTTSSGADALAAYLAVNSPVSAPALDRVAAAPPD
jgi:5'-nucleotidase